jgi:putative hemolysin
MPVLHHANNLELHLTRDIDMIRKAQQLRYEVFYKEMGAVHKDDQDIDADLYDDHADHLIVTDGEAGSEDAAVVGCYRLQRWSEARRGPGLYTASEFDLTALTRPECRLVEVGRSCVAAGYRSGTVMQLLWRGIAHYLARYQLEMMIGCASFPGTDANAIAAALHYLHQEHLAPRSMRPRALPGQRAIVPAAVTEAAIADHDMRKVRRSLPPLIKAYLRMGASVGDGAIIDHDFNTIDVCIVLPTTRLHDRYLRHFASPEKPAAAAA